MKKLLFVVMLTLFAVTVLRAQNGWVTHKGDNRVSVKFPVEPKEIVAGTYMATKDSSIVYVFTIVDFTAFGVDSVALAPMKATPEFAAQIKTGMMKSLPDVDLEDYKIGTWKGFTSYTTTGTDSKRKKYDILMFIIGNKLYSASTVRSYGTGTQGRDDYFASIELTH